MSSMTPPPPQPPPVGVRKLKMSELGVTGLSRWGGYVDEEFLPQLKGDRAVKVYREMADNDAVIGSVIFAIDMLLRQATWRVEPGGPTYEDEAAAEFVEQCMEDLSHSWEEFISEVMSMLVYGFSWHEVVYKRRLGDSRNPMLRSKYKDGRIAWRKLPIRSQDTLLEWEFKESDGGIEGMWQMAPPNFERTFIPITKSMLFRTTQHKGNPQGRSILRSAYRSWYFLKRLQEVEGIGIERDLAGLPMGRIPSEYLHEIHKGENADEERLAVAKGWLDLVRNTKRDEQEGVLIPSDIDEHGNRLWDFELLSTGGTRQVDTDKVVARYEQRIAMTVLADFILLGHDQVGSYALSTSKTGMFRTALNAWLGAIASVLNEHELPRLFELNGWKLKSLPRFVPEEIESPPLDELGNYIKALSGSGMQLFPDDELENTLRSFGKLPEKSEEAMLEQEERRADPLGQLGLNPEQNNGKPGNPAKLNPFAEQGATGLPFGNGKVDE